MKENIKIHVSELFKRHEINDRNLEKEMINTLEERYEKILEETNNEVISFNKTISLIGDINKIKEENRVIVNEVKKELLFVDKKKIMKFSKYSFLICVVLYIAFSLIFNSWLTSWSILVLPLFLTQLYKIYISAKITSKSFKIVNATVNILSILLLLITTSLGAFFSNYDYKFELNDKTLIKQEIFDQDIDKLDINLLKADLHLKIHDEDEIIVNQYAKNKLKKAYEFTSSLNDKNLIIKEEDTSYIFAKYYYTVYEVLVPSNKINEINLYSISSDFNIDLIGSLKMLTVESTSGNISLNGNKSNVQENIKLTTLQGYIDVVDLYANKLELSSSSGYITLNNSIIDDAKLSTLGGSIIIENLMANNLNATANSGAIYFNTSIAKFNLNSKDGLIKVNNIMALDNSYIKTENGDIYFNFAVNREYNLEVKTENGTLNNEYYDDLEGINIYINSINGNIYILMNEIA